MGTEAARVKSEADYPVVKILMVLGQEENTLTLAMIMMVGGRVGITIRSKMIIMMMGDIEGILGEEEEGDLGILITEVEDLEVDLGLTEVEEGAVEQFLWLEVEIYSQMTRKEVVVEEESE